MCLVINYKYTPTNKVWDGVFMNHLVCPSVDQSSYKKETLKVFTSHTDCWWPEGVSWFWSKVLGHAPSHRKEKLHNTCPAYTFSWRNIWSFYFTQRLLTTRGSVMVWFKVIWASLEPLEGTVHNSCVVYSFLMEIHLKFLLHTKIAWPTKDLRLCLESLAKGYLDTLRVIVKNANFCLGHIL